MISFHVRGNVLLDALVMVSVVLVPSVNAMLVCYDMMYVYKGGVTIINSYLRERERCDRGDSWSD